ncbi:aldo/keto reductase [Calidifontibacter indicus]|uniref:Diketogulonate reductase-like aldo/keto reductase n=1 Tax=Calidifontibacter indicus TaxID=419650 RepID=A0A3D9UIP2_9MICO|nr:aldo/keto reductase [Calidifontibacter indicus]REF29167.1 diketogulonate reductase-like aldo/keto reductase [Calidifontibacter indicus]
MNSHTLNDSTEVPAIGFGTYPLKDEEGITAIVGALEAGYRYLDTAVNYGNETEVGEALRRSGLPREDVRIATKIPGRFHAKDLALTSLRDSAQRLGVEQIDVGLIHWPNPSVGLYVEAWQALVEAQQEGLVRTIGVSNFTGEHLRRIIDETGVTPAINQIEVHPLFPQQEMLQVDADLGILTQAWSPMGKRSAPFEAEPVAAAAKAHDVSPGQVILRWHLQRGVMPLPKSATPSRQADNLDVFGFELSQQEVDAISALGRPDGRLFGGDPDTHDEQ